MKIIRLAARIVSRLAMVAGAPRASRELDRLRQASADTGQLTVGAEATSKKPDPSTDEIRSAAAAYDNATEQARAADRGKRSARKILDRIPAGRYGDWLISRAPSGRSTVDLEAVRRIFEEHRLGPVPMKTTAMSLKVERVARVQVAA